MIGGFGMLDKLVISFHLPLFETECFAEEMTTAEGSFISGAGDFLNDIAVYHTLFRDDARFILKGNGNGVVEGGRYVLRLSDFGMSKVDIDVMKSRTVGDLDIFVFEQLWVDIFEIWLFLER